MNPTPESDFHNFSEIIYSNSNSGNFLTLLESIPKSDIYYFDSDSSKKRNHNTSSVRGVKQIKCLKNPPLRADSEEFRVECLGVLGNLTIPELDFERMLGEYDLIPWMKDRIVEATNGRLAGGLGELDDLILEIVV